MGDGLHPGPARRPAGLALGSGTKSAVTPDWRLMPGGPRVTYWRDTDGRHGDVVIDDGRLAR
jgi:hypothetical protein